MRLRLSLLTTVAAGAMLGVPATASAYFVHVVARGESLSSIAAQDGLSVDALAAANGLSPDTQLLAGSTIQIPPQGGERGRAVDVARVVLVRVNRVLGIRRRRGAREHEHVGRLRRAAR